MTAARVATAYLVRDLRVELSYRTGFLLKVGAGLMAVALFYFVARFVRNVAPTTFEEYGGYFSFVVVGLAVAAYMNRGIGEIAGEMRKSQAFGALEIMILSPTRLPTLLLSASFPPYIIGLVTLLAYLVAGAALGADIERRRHPGGARLAGRHDPELRRARAVRGRARLRDEARKPGRVGDPRGLGLARRRALPRHGPARLAPAGLRGHSADARGSISLATPSCSGRA